MLDLLDCVKFVRTSPDQIFTYLPAGNLRLILSFALAVADRNHTVSQLLGGLHEAKQPVPAPLFGRYSTFDKSGSNSLCELGVLTEPRYCSAVTSVAYI
jgi:hypothetical protein